METIKNFATQRVTPVDNNATNALNNNDNTQATSKDHSMRNAAFAGVGGLILGAIGTTLVSATTAETTEETVDQVEEPVAAEQWQDGEIKVASGVTDEMSFGEAFAAAREEVGTGGVFEWKGNLYGTYTEAEWNAMTPEEQDAWGDHFNWEQIDTETKEPEDTNETEQSAETGTETEPATEDEPESTVDQEAETATDSEADMQINRVVEDNTEGYGYAEGTYNGHQAVLLDADNDGIVDYAVVDVNDNNDIDEGEIVDLRESGISLREVAEENNLEVEVYGDAETEVVVDETEVDETEVVYEDDETQVDEDFDTDMDDEDIMEDDDEIIDIDDI